MKIAELVFLKVFVEVGRVALIQQKRYKNKLAVIVNVVDQRRAICDIFHPHGKEVRLIARASIAFKTLRLTKLIVEGFQWSAHSKVVTDKYKECKIQEKFQATKFYEAWQKKIKVFSVLAIQLRIFGTSVIEGFQESNRALI